MNYVLPEHVTSDYALSHVAISQLTYVSWSVAVRKNNT